MDVLAPRPVEIMDTTTTLMSDKDDAVLTFLTDVLHVERDLSTLSNFSRTRTEVVPSVDLSAAAYDDDRSTSNYTSRQSEDFPATLSSLVDTQTNDWADHVPLEPSTSTAASQDHELQPNSSSTNNEWHASLFDHTTC